MVQLRILLDTHIFLWWLFDDPKLPNGIKKQITNRKNKIYVSAVSVWEIATKFRIGKLPEAEVIARNTPAWIDKAGFISLPITVNHAQLSGSWDVLHRDPFDRMLAAQASLEKMSLASVDEALTQFKIDILDY